MEAVRKTTIGVLAIVLFLSGTAFAATNPDTATESSSTGSSDLSVTIPVLWRISGIADLTTANYSDNTSSVSLSMNDDVCIYTNNSAGTGYQITMAGSSTATTTAVNTGDNSGGDIFAISNAANDQHIPYHVYWNDATGLTGRAQVGSEGGSSATLTAQTNASRDWQCSDVSGNNANFSLDFDREDILDVLHGAYTGTLTITLAPTP